MRISGPATADLLHQFCRHPDGRSIDFQKRPRHQFHVHVQPPDSDTLLDDGLATFFQGPASYTGEDSAELGLHGNPLLLRRVMRALLHSRLCRAARPGEFTLRAWENGRMDLSQAEAVHTLITARNELELEIARKNVSGELTREFSRLRSAMIHLKAETEAEVDFAEEDLSFESRDDQIRRVQDLMIRAQDLLRRGRETGRLRGGFQVALVGVPNAGKSSLLNALLGWERAIVSSTAGTTRDYLDAEMEMEGLPVRFVDTAGLHSTADQIEQAGIMRSRKAVDQSQLVLHILDGGRPPYELPALESRARILYLYNKSDLGGNPAAWQPQIDPAALIAISSRTGAGLPQLRQRILAELESNDHLTNPLLLEDRHQGHLEAIIGSLQRLTDLWRNNAPAEIAALEIETALYHTGAMTGQIENEEVLGRIFSVFCVGK
ncbi:MAG: tRNA uridine-5-carboxymethylaminomethyl(34) synthesis GTPase MnmE [Leptospiraceae bacterium]|nr:tRNA uridine-5-carboxymethylaminomethyl(34) synthesis GTPase MnmE [Leptospiraceae bacterium]